MYYQTRQNYETDDTKLPLLVYNHWRIFSASFNIR